MGGTPAPLAPHMSHKRVYMHTGTSGKQADPSGGATKYDFQASMNILESHKDIEEAIESHSRPVNKFARARRMRSAEADPGR